MYISGIRIGLRDLEMGRWHLDLVTRDILLLSSLTAWAGAKNYPTNITPPSIVRPHL